MREWKHRALLIALTLAAAMCSRPASAGLFIGKLTAHFENPVLQGNIDRASGPMFYDNSSTAQFTISNSADGSFAEVFYGLSGGADSAGSSQIHFTPNQTVNVSGNTEFALGDLYFFNTNNTFESLIFGVDLVIDFVQAGGSGPVDELRITISITTTENQSGVASDDFLSSPDLPQALHVLEQFGGHATMEGEIVGDPFIHLDGLSVVPDRFDFFNGSSLFTDLNPADFGFTISQFAVTTETPEPSTMILLGAGSLGLLIYRKQSRAGGR